MSQGLDHRYLRTGPLNPNRRPDAYEMARRVWGEVDDDLKALTRVARMAGLKGLGWQDGRLWMTDSDGTMTLIEDAADIARLAADRI